MFESCGWRLDMLDGPLKSMRLLQIVFSDSAR
jgi:hypothetical protein